MDGVLCYMPVPNERRPPDVMRPIQGMTAGACWERIDGCEALGRCQRCLFKHELLTAEPRNDIGGAVARLQIQFDSSRASG